MKFTKDEIRASLLLYAVTDRTWLNGRPLTEDVERVLANGATFLQIREKAQAARYHVPFVVNDSIEVALECGADGVHMGQSDLAGKPVRSLIGPDKILGISANTVDAAVAAEQAGADYIGAGAVFSTTTKADAGSLTLARLRAICDAVTIPVVAIGGINADNLPALKGSGVDGVAVVSALFAQRDAGAAAARLRTRAEELVGRHG